ncbi:MAG: DUF2089 domain-containing protein [Chthonomonadales bacterium]
MHPLPDRCPVCGERPHITEIGCAHCGATLRSTFEVPPYCTLTPEHRRLLELFLRCRGNISALAEALGVSFPTATRRLDALLAALGMLPAAPAPEPSGLAYTASRVEDRRKELETERARILELLDRGEITAEEATRRLKEM